MTQADAGVVRREIVVEAPMSIRVAAEETLSGAN